MSVMNVRRLISATALAGAVALGATALTACSGASAAGTADGKLNVVASFYPLQFLAEQIGGTHAEVSSLTKPGVEPHDLEITPRQTARLDESDVVLYLKSLQPAVDKAVEQAGTKTKVDAAELTTMEVHLEGEEGHAEEGGDHGHDHGEAGEDPHVWLDPVKYAEIAKGVGKAFEKADPAHAADYKKNTEALVAKLGALDTEFRNGLKAVPGKTFITTHSAFGYLAERYGLDQEGIAGVDPESEPSPARMKELQALAKKEKVTTVFFETLASPKTADTLAADLGLKTDVLDPLEGISDKSQGKDYFEVMRANLNNLEKALGAK
ncbi:metal ABC transporter substrate-binding protein [Streptomyces bambusae]|uniref:metal ABC transporter substrate-binding protein n=1 Tax=Streptomyces bambusae TaxID=1550616 RepID=UPI001CFD6933|nr:metal ABC transporter substrate-binding protein [Streptomyces bambusae]MCB5164819.1 metal ABC transporter substrate-binding protein [Streptomyces bambusae]